MNGLFLYDLIQLRSVGNGNVDIPVPHIDIRFADVFFMSHSFHAENVVDIDCIDAEAENQYPDQLQRNTMEMM